MEDRVDRLERVAGGLAVLSIIYIVIIWTAPISPGWLFTLYVADLMICGVFAWEYARRFSRAPQKLTFLKYHGFEILFMVPAAVFFPIIHLSWIAILMRLFRLTRSGLVLGTKNRFIQTASQCARRANLL